MLQIGTVTVAPVGTITLGDHENLIETWNRIRLYTVPRNANMTWGDKSFTDVNPRVIQDMTTARGEITGGVCGTLNDTGKAFFLKRWRSTMIDHHALLFLTNAVKLSIKTHVAIYVNYNPDTGKTAYNGTTILSIIFQMMRSNVQVNVFNKIGTMKDATLASYNNNINEWINKM